VNIGVDIGYHKVKAVTDSRKVNFASVVGTPDKARFSLNGNDEFIITVNGQSWQVGNSAVKQSRFVKRREDRGWIESNEYYVLYLAALSELTSANWVDLNIVTGLPVKFFMNDKDNVRALLQGDHRIQREGRGNQVFRSITVVVVPQPFGTVAAVVLNQRGEIIDPDLANGEIGIIDIGGKTTNLLSVSELAEIGHETASIDTGGWDAVRQMRDYLAEHYPDLELRDHKIAEIVQTGQATYYGKPIDLTDAIGDILDPMADEIISQASQLWNGGANLHAILITGGGANLLGDRIKRNYRHAQVVENPQYANAIGYWKMAQRIK